MLDTDPRELAYEDIKKLSGDSVIIHNYCKLYENKFQNEYAGILLAIIIAQHKTIKNQYEMMQIHMERCITPQYLVRLDKDKELIYEKLGVKSNANR